MQRINTHAIVLRRTNYAEADRIIKLFTKDNGKLSAMARGVRKPKSKLAGGIELFSVCNVSLIKGRGELFTLTSSRMDRHFGEIIKDYDVTQYAYSMLKLSDAVTDDELDGSYFELLETGLSLLNDNTEIADIIMCWFVMQLMQLNGSLPNLITEINGNDLQLEGTYNFSVEDGGFFSSVSGVYGSDEIKAWRVFAQATAQQIVNISGLKKAAESSVTMLEQFAAYQT